MIFASNLEKTEAKRHLLPFLESSKKVSARYLKSISDTQQVSAGVSICKQIEDTLKKYFYLPADKVSSLIFCKMLFR